MKKERMALQCNSLGKGLLHSISKSNDLLERTTEALSEWHTAPPLPRPPLPSSLPLSPQRARRQARVDGLISD